MDKQRNSRQRAQLRVLLDYGNCSACAFEIQGGSFILSVFFGPTQTIIEQGRTKLFGRESAAGTRRRLASEKRAADQAVDEKVSQSPPIISTQSPVASA